MGPERPNNRSGNCLLRYARRITLSCSNKTERCRTISVNGRSFIAYPSKWRVSKLLKHRKRDRTNVCATNLVTHQLLGPLMCSTFRWGCSDPTCIRCDCLHYKELRLELRQIVWFSLRICRLCPTCQARILASSLRATLSFGVIVYITCNLQMQTFS
jgi:hypothetical protein